VSSIIAKCLIRPPHPVAPRAQAVPRPVAAPRVALVAVLPVVGVVRTRAVALVVRAALPATVLNDVLTAPAPRPVLAVRPAVAPRAATATPVPTATVPVRRGSAVARHVALVKMAVTPAPSPIAPRAASIAMTPATTVVVVPRPQPAALPLAGDRRSPTPAADVPRRVAVRLPVGVMNATPVVTAETLVT